MNAIEQAVAPLKNDAMLRAEKEAQRQIDRVLARLEECGWDVNVAAPRPNTRMGRNEYVQQMAIHTLFLSITTHDANKPSRRPGDPHIRVRSEANEQRFIGGAKSDAALQYDAFVCKLVEKIGEVESATLEGNHVWGHSILHVVKPEGETEKWKTQQIVNVSKLGTVFNQWPTRLVK